MCHFPTKMLPTLCREFSNWLCIVFEESWLWQKVSHLKCQLEFLHKKNDWCSREIRWKWCYLNKSFLRSFVWYQTSQELSSTVIYFYQNFTDLWEFGLSVPSNSVKWCYVSNGDNWRLLKVLNCILATQYRSVGQHFTLSVHLIVFFMLKWKIQ